MTTIAWDGKMLAANRGMIISPHAYSEDKIERVVVQREHWSLPGIKSGVKAFFTGAGMSQHIDRYRNWLETVDDDDPPDTDQCHCLLVTKRLTLMIDSAGLGSKVRKPIGLGSGGEIAFGAMLAGKSAADAVRLVAKHAEPNMAFGGIQAVLRAWL